jgi:hypothetical protein
MGKSKERKDRGLMENGEMERQRSFKGKQRNWKERSLRKRWWCGKIWSSKGKMEE